MNVQKVALVAEIIGGAGVIISLLFVGVQVKAEAESQGSQAVLDVRMALAEQGRHITASKELSDFIYRGRSEYDLFTDAERFRYGQILGVTLNTYSIAFEYGQLGKIDPAEFSTWGRGLCSILAHPGPRTVYEGSPMLTPEFREWVQDECL